MSFTIYIYKILWLCHLLTERLLSIHYITIMKALLIEFNTFHKCDKHIKVESHSIRQLKKQEDYSSPMCHPTSKLLMFSPHLVFPSNLYFTKLIMFDSPGPIWGRLWNNGSAVCHMRGEPYANASCKVP